MKRFLVPILMSALMLGCNQGEEHYTGPYVGEMYFYIESDTLSFDYSIYSFGHQTGYDFFQMQGAELDTFNPDGMNEAVVSIYSYTPGLYYINNSGLSYPCGYFLFSAVSPGDTTVYYKTYNMTSESDSHFVQLDQFTVESINGSFQCYVQTFDDSVSIGLKKATGTFKFLGPIH